MTSQATTEPYWEENFVFMTPEATPWMFAKNAELRLRLFDVEEALTDANMEKSAANHALAIGGDYIAGLDKEVEQLKAEAAELRTIVEQFAPAEVGEFCTWAEAAKEAITQKDAEIERLKAANQKLTSDVAQLVSWNERIAHQLSAVEATRAAAFEGCKTRDQEIERLKDRLRLAGYGAWADGRDKQASQATP